MKVVTSDQMRQIDRSADNMGLTTEILMENAGRSVAEETRKLVGDIKGKNIAVLIGPGNNGGDGLVAARYLQDFGGIVHIYMCSNRAANDKNFLLTQEKNVTTIFAEKDADASQLMHELNHCSIVIDAIFGTGKKRALTGVYKQTLTKLAVAKQNRPELMIIAVDIPSGMDSDNGTIDPVCPKADATITLGFPKTGLYNFPGAKRTGKVIIADIGLPPSLAKDINTELITEDYVRSVLPNRSPNSNKGTFGRVMVVAGSTNYIGAAYLACMGAARSGAGLVTLAAAESLIPILAAKLTETTYIPLPEADHGAIGADAFPVIKKQLPDYRVILMGCGLGQHAETVKFVKSMLFDSSQAHYTPVLLDADALNALSKQPEWWHKLGENVILTPHPGEMARLSDVSLEEVQKERLSFAQNAAKEWQKIVVLKGAYTIIADPDGRTRISAFANAALASAGTGDVLAGIIAGLIGQNMPLFDAAVSGVFLHAGAAELLIPEMGNAGIIASDLLTSLPRLMKKIREKGPAH
jgi:ADP-dependent NAD(P)H-hydrate dehydratase / NAD(P)H-hydrate epimerase